MRNRGNICNNRWADVRVFVRASGEAISAAQRYFSKHFLISFLCRASGEAILGTQRYLSKHFLIISVGFAPPARRF